MAGGQTGRFNVGSVGEHASEEKTAELCQYSARSFAVSNLNLLHVAGLEHGVEIESKFDLEYLAVQYNAALQQAYDTYLAQQITYQDTEALKVCLFFQELGLPSRTAIM
jgi:hypothetical protein